MRIVALAALFAAGMLLSVGLGVGAAENVTTTETATTTTTVEQTTTAPATTVVTTETVQQTTTRKVVVPTSGTTTASSESAGNTPTWVWILLALLVAAVIGLAVAMLVRGPSRGMAPAERRRRLDHAVATWAAQGWALQSQTGESAVLQRDRELMLVSVDDAGQVSSRPLPR
jgi:hypothetical protein